MSVVVLLAVVKIGGVFPLLCTPYTEKGEVDYATLAKEAAFVADCGANGVIWPAADDALKLLTPEEEKRGWAAIAGALKDRDVWFCPCCPGTNVTDQLRRLKDAEAAASGGRMTALVRMVNDATTDEQYKAQYEQVAAAFHHPVIIQTYNGKSPMPSMELMINLAKRFPETYGWFKVEGSDKIISERMAELLAAKPVVKTVFTGWGGRDWLYQYRRIGTRGVISQRPMYADLMVKVWRALESGDPRADELFAKFMYLRNLDNVLPSANMRGWNLYVLKKRGIFPNTLSREPQKDGMWKLEDLKLTDGMKAEIDARLEYALGLPKKPVPPTLIEVRTDKTNCLYCCGELAEFTLVAKVTNTLINVILDNFGTNRIASAIWDLSKTNSFTIAGTLEGPGFLRLRTDPAPIGAVKVWSVGFDPEKIRKGSPSPEDFDAYWAGERARLAREVPLDPQLVRVPVRCTAEFDFYRVSFATFGRRVYGYLSVPTDKAMAPYPVDVEVNAAGFGSWTNDMAGRPDAICLRFSVYPFEMDWKWKEKGLQTKYDEMNASYGRKYACKRYCTAGLSASREECFFHAVLLGLDRAVDWVVARPDVDRARIRYQGTSQGGGFGFYLTGLNHAFTRAAFYVPAITDTMGYLRGRQSGWPQPVENNAAENRATVEKWAPYFDGANFASRIRCPVRVAVGFSDTTCAPCAVYAAYNEIQDGDKKIVHGIGMTHGCFAKFYEELGAWAREGK